MGSVRAGMLRLDLAGRGGVKTQEIELGTGLTSPILRYHPAVVAQAAATLEYMAPGRVYLAVGTREAINDFAATGMWPGYAKRRERLAEAHKFRPAGSTRQRSRPDVSLTLGIPIRLRP